MLSYFPQIRDEESTYSILARLQLALQPPNFELLGNMLFGRKTEVGRLNFQGSFDYLCGNLPASFTPETFLYKNTIYPLFTPFISEEKQMSAIEYFKGAYPDKLHKCLKISEVTRTRTYIRVCKECVNEDFKTYGEPYYHRQHEIALNCMCHKHRIPLYEYEIFPYKLPCRYNDFYTVLGSAKPIEVPNRFKDKLLEITDDIAFIFSHNFDGWNIEVTRKRISNRIAEKGYVTANNVTLQKKFSEDFKVYYTDEFLDYMGLNFDINENDSWIRHTTTRKKLTANPLKFILVIRFLFGNFKNFYHYNYDYSLFRHGPYPCLNIVCPEYEKPVINDIMQVNISHGYPLATFKCKRCGFTYSRRGPDDDDSDLYKKTYVKDYGHLWHEKLKEYAKQGFSLRKISKLLGCTNLDSIKTYISSISDDKDISKERHQLSEVAVTSDELALVEKYKAMFTSIININPSVNSLDLYRKYPDAYKLVSTYDRDWIENTLLRKEEPKISNQHRLQEYWKQKDDYLSKEILAAIDRIKSEKELFERITIGLIQKYIGYYNLYQNKDKLPNCFEITNCVCETIPHYQKRRVDFVMKQKAISSKKITLSKVLYDAGLRDRAGQDVINYIEKKINEHNQGKIIR
jgi:transposase-like protein